MDNTTMNMPVVPAAYGNNDGWGFGSGGIFYIVILFLFFAMMMGGNGLWGNRNGDYGQYATAATQQEILFNQHFNQLNDRLTSIGNGICDLGYRNARDFGDLSKENALGQSNIIQSVMGTGNNIQSQLAECCCTTQRAIDAVNANIDAKFAALEKSQLEGRIAQLEQANNQLYIREQMSNVVRYPSGYTYNAGASPFCGGGCCNGNM